MANIKRAVSNISQKAKEKFKHGSHEQGYFDETGDYVRHHGLHWVVTGLFVAGDIAGGGLVALPTAIIRSQFWPGMICMAIMTCVTAFTSYVLGKSWLILIRQYPEYRTHTRKPYPEIAFRACGRRMRNIVSVCIDVTQFGVSCVYLLLSSKSIHDFIQAFFHVEVSYCYVILAVAVALLPVTFLKSPQDFWAAVVLAMFTTAIAVVLITVGAANDLGTCQQAKQMPDFTITNYLLALGTLIFSFGGHAAFPTIQHDMKRPSEFTKSTILAFGLTAAMYIPVCIISYLTYGDSLRDSVINSIQTNWIQKTVNMLICVHCILATIIVINPINQELEELFKLPQEFSIKRVIARTGTMIVLVFVAESVPNFGPLLDLVGGSTLTLTSILLPCVFYLFLNNAERVHRENGRPDGKGDMERISWREALKEKNKLIWGFCMFIFVFGIIGGAAATFTAIKELADAQFIPPCYVQPFIHSEDKNGGSPFNCCGHFQNVSRLPEGLECSKADMKYYTS